MKVKCVLLILSLNLCIQLSLQQLPDIMDILSITNSLIPNAQQGIGSSLTTILGNLTNIFNIPVNAPVQCVQSFENAIINLTNADGSFKDTCSAQLLQNITTQANDIITNVLSIFDLNIFDFFSNLQNLGQTFENVLAFAASVPVKFGSCLVSQLTNVLNDKVQGFVKLLTDCISPPQPTTPTVPNPTPKPTPPGTPKPTPFSTPKPTPPATPKPTPPPTPKPTPPTTPPSTPKPTPPPTPKPTPTPPPTPKPTPASTPKPTPTPGQDWN